MDKTAIVILHYKGELDTKDCLESIFKYYGSRPPFIIILVTNAASLIFNSTFKKTFPMVEIINNTDNLGYATANNIGIKQALKMGSKYIILLNNDTLISAGIVEKLLTYAGTIGRIGLISPKIYFAKGYEYHQNLYKEKEKGKIIWFAGGRIDWNNIYASHRGVDEFDQGQYDKICETDFATGCCMLVTRELIEKVGFFDEKYFLYYEDIDLSIRARRNNFKVMYYPDTHLWHKNASSSGKPGSTIHIYYQTRNRLYFGFKYALWNTKKALLIDSIKLISKGDIYRSSVFDFYFGRMGKGSL